MCLYFLVYVFIIYVLYLCAMVTAYRLDENALILRFTPGRYLNARTVCSVYEFLSGFVFPNYFSS